MKFDWQQFLEQYSRALLSDRGIRDRTPNDVASSAWMGYAPATESQLQELEHRIGLGLPKSYRQFLATSNGWRDSGGFIYEIWPTDKVDWFRVNHQDWIDAYTEPDLEIPSISIEDHCNYTDEQDPCRFRVEYLQSALQISDVGDSAIYLLNPEIKTIDGEWEAWFFANWSPGATRYRSFRELMQAEHRSIIDLRDHDEQRYFPEDGIDTLPPKTSGLIASLAEKSQSHREGQKQRLSRGAASIEEYTNGVIAALEEAEAVIRKIMQPEVLPKELLRELVKTANVIEEKWKSNFRGGECAVEYSDGYAEGNREAAGIIRWFINQPQG